MGTQREMRIKQTKSMENVLAMFVATTGISSFGTAVWPHHRAFRELWSVRSKCVGLKQLVDNWEFHVTSEAGYALRDLPQVLWNLAAEGWLERGSGGSAFVPTDALRDYGCHLLAQLNSPDALMVARVGQRWKAWASMASKIS